MKKKVLILCAHRPGRSPSQRYRFEQYLPFLEQNGFVFTWSFLLDENDDRIFYAPGKFFQKAWILAKTFLQRMRDAGKFKAYDIIFVQRESHFLGTALFEKKAARSGARLIFDFDDSIWLADTSPGNKKWEFVKWPGKFFEAVQAAKLVIAGNEYLASVARQVSENVLIIPTTVDTDLHKPLPHPPRDRVVIGWSGSISTIKHFFLLRPVLKRILTEFQQVEIRVISDKPYADPELPLSSVVWNPATEVKEINEFDIGIMPLPDNEWTMGKCGLKALTYMACGIPAVLSNVGVNPEIIANGQNGFLCAGDTEWLQVLRTLINDKTLRESIGSEGRNTVVERYSVLANRDKYLRAFVDT